MARAAEWDSRFSSLSFCWFSVGFEPGAIRADSGSLPITHDFLATMLRTDRPNVSLAAGVLQRKNLIEYTRGAVKILNPQET
jgi:Crp-like helix-turn-helix protein